VRRKTWVLAAAAIVIALAATGAVVITAGPKQQTLAAQPSPVTTAQVQKRTLSAMVSQPGTLTYRGQSDGSPYSVINQARGTFRPAGHSPSCPRLARLSLRVTCCTA